MQRELQHITTDPGIQALLGQWQIRATQVLQDALVIQAVAAPTFYEEPRARFVEERMRAIGLEDVHRDAVGNVYGRSRGGDPLSPAVLVSAHLDTVFPADTDLTTRVDTDHGRIYGPGLGDNSLSVAAMLALAKRVQAENVALPADIWWVATVGEEGLGDLRGMREAVRELGDEVGVAVVLEGVGLGWIYHAGLRVRRLRIAVSGPGGHAWVQPAAPSAIHHLLRLGAAALEAVKLPDNPRSSFNIGLIEGGTSINTRAPHASFSVDLRSVDAAALEAQEKALRRVLAGVPTPAELAVSIDVIGDRPSGRLDVRHPLVIAAQSVLRKLDFHEPTLSTGSTDANALLAAGIPTVCIGLTTGGGVHTSGEYIETKPVAAGLQQMTLLVILAAHNASAWQRWDARTQ